MNAAIEYLESKIEIIKEIEATLFNGFVLQFDMNDASVFIQLGLGEEERVSLCDLNKDSFYDLREV